MSTKLLAVIEYSVTCGDAAIIDVSRSEFGAMMLSYPKKSPAAASVTLMAPPAFALSFLKAFRRQSASMISLAVVRRGRTVWCTARTYRRNKK